MNQPATPTALIAVDPATAGTALETYGQLRALKAALGITDLTDEELQLFALVARHTGLDPFSRQIYAVKRKGKVTHQTGIDGYRSIAEDTREYAGSREPEYEDCTCGEAPKDHPKLARVTIHRIRPDGITVDQVGVARWHELYPGAGDEGFMWRKMPHSQLAKCAEANGLRKALPRRFAGVYIADEMAGPTIVDGDPAAEAAAGDPAPARTNQATVSRIAARRAALERRPATPSAAGSGPGPDPTSAPEPSLADAIRIATAGSDARGAATKVAIARVIADTFGGWDGGTVTAGLLAIYGTQDAVDHPTAAQVDALRAILDPMEPDERLAAWQQLIADQARTAK